MPHVFAGCLPCMAIRIHTSIWTVLGPFSPTHTLQTSMSSRDSLETLPCRLGMFTLPLSAMAISCLGTVCELPTPPLPRAPSLFFFFHICTSYLLPPASLSHQSWHTFSETEPSPAPRFYSLPPPALTTPHLLKSSFSSIWRLT